MARARALIRNWPVTLLYVLVVGCAGLSVHLDHRQSDKRVDAISAEAERADYTGCVRDEKQNDAARDLAQESVDRIQAALDDATDPIAVSRLTSSLENATKTRDDFTKKFPPLECQEP